MRKRNGRVKNMNGTGKGGDNATSAAQPKTNIAKCNVFRPRQATQMSKVEKYTLRQLVNTVYTHV